MSIATPLPCILTPPAGEVVNEVLWHLLQEWKSSRTRSAITSTPPSSSKYICRKVNTDYHSIAGSVVLPPLRVWVSVASLSVQCCRRTCLVHPQVVSSWVGGGANFPALYLAKLKGVALDSLWRLGSRGPLSTSPLSSTTSLLCMWICMISVYKGKLAGGPIYFIELPSST
jgi:hypothetical protein